MSSTFIIGETRKVLASMPAESVDLVFTSPPFLALRSYLPPDHPDKALEIGSEPTPGEFIDALLDVVEACARVLTPHGSLVFELGDTYSGSGGGGGDYLPGGIKENQPGFGGSAEKAREGNAAHWRQKNRNRTRDSRPGRESTDTAWTPRPEQGGGDGWPDAKSLCLIPESFRWALAYGRNPFTGRETDRWRIRNVVRWCRPNPPVGALGDKFRPGTSDLAVCCKSKTRWFDLDAVRTEAIDQRHRTTNGPKGRAADATEVQTGNYTTRVPSNEAGAPPLDWWEIPTQGYAGSHYATFPEKLLVRPIEAMCPRQVCRQCGEPRRRITETVNAVGEAMGRRSWRHDTEGKHTGEIEGKISSAPTADVRTLGWTDCGHDDYRRGVVLDPFAGSGTTLAVAEGHGRDSIGIDLDARNADLARARCGEMFLTVESSTEAVA